MASKLKVVKKPPYSSKQFLLEDLPRTLFPLSTNRVLVETGSEKILAYAAELAAGNGSFLPQRRVHANKDELHLRRTVKLDPVAEFYLYDLIYRNRERFRKPHTKDRCHFGYHFSEGKPLPPSRSYGAFRKRVYLLNYFKNGSKMNALIADILQND